MGEGVCEATGAARGRGRGRGGGGGGGACVPGPTGHVVPATATTLSGAPFGARVPSTALGNSGTWGGGPAPHLLLFKILKAQTGRAPKAWQACDNRINRKPKAFRKKPKGPKRVAGMVQVNQRETESFPDKTERSQTRGRNGTGKESRQQKMSSKNTKTLNCVVGM